MKLAYLFELVLLVNRILIRPFPFIFYNFKEETNNFELNYFQDIETNEKLKKFFYLF